MRQILEALTAERDGVKMTLSNYTKEIKQIENGQVPIFGSLAKSHFAQTAHKTMFGITKALLAHLPEHIADTHLKKVFDGSICARRIMDLKHRSDEREIKSVGSQLVFWVQEQPSGLVGDYLANLLIACVEAKTATTH